MGKITAFLVALLATATLLFCQYIRTATLVGTVTDASGAVVAKVAVTVTNVDTQVVTRGLTNAEDAYYMDANNLFPEVRWLYTANNTVNLTNPQLFGKFSATIGYSFNWYGADGTLAGVLRIAF